ncbi:MAG: transposase domain-containing protein [Desulfatiglandales bacterium]
MSLIHTCRLEGINPLKYLAWLLKNVKQLEKSPEGFMPWNYDPQS